MNWKIITDIKDLDTISTLSKSTPCVIYKHSSRCTMSEMMQHILESDWKFEDDEVQPYFLDILQHRNIAIAIAERFEVYHQSPQLLLIQDEICTYDADHLDISVGELAESLADDFWN